MFSKKIVAAAALLALTAGAQAGVNAYGMVDMSFGSFRDYEGVFDSETKELIGVSKGKSLTKVQSGGMATSFIGFSGSEDLGGGLKAEFVLESFIGADTGSTGFNMAGGFWGRGSYLALSGSFGKVALGQYDNAFFTMGLSYNPFGSSMTFSPTMVSYYSFLGGAGAILGYDTGWVNSITYESPNMSGFTFGAQFAPKESSSSDSDVKDHFALSGAYNAGPLSLMAVYTTSGASGQGYLARQKNFGLGASYDFGAAKLMGQYTNVKDSTDGVDATAKFYQIGATVPVSAAGAVLVSYGETKYEDDGKLQQFSLGYDHTLSKRTDAYVALTNKKVTDLGSVNTFAVGLRHNF